MCACVCLCIGLCGKVQESTFSGAAVVRAEPFRAGPVGGEWSVQWRGHTDRAGGCVTCTACVGVVIRLPCNGFSPCSCRMSL